MLGSVFEQDRAALTVGNEVQMRWRIDHAKLFRDNVALQLGALVSAVTLRPGHADPASGADAPAEAAVVGITVSGLVRIKRAGGDFFGKKAAHLGAECLAFVRQANRIELEIGGHREATKGQNSSTPPRATRLPSSAAQ